MQTPATFRLADSDTRLVAIVKELLGPLFILYDYFVLGDQVYADLVESFRVGQVT